MARFAELDENNIVLQVIIVGNEITTIDDVEVEQRGIDFLNDLFPDSGTWVQTSMWTWDGKHHGEDGNEDGGTPLRGRHAGIGFTYDPSNDIFHAPKPYPSWTLNTTTAEWEAPSAYVLGYEWDEDTLAWVKPDTPFASWVTWNEELGRWEPPVAHPGEEGGAGVRSTPFLLWDEDTTAWVEVT
tara:strand:+ start:551 stop:1102 length:552 start_codon:yes stop_codon:yes gene_type:complete